MKKIIFGLTLAFSLVLCSFSAMAVQDTITNKNYPTVQFQPNTWVTTVTVTDTVNGSAYIGTYVMTGGQGAYAYHAPDSIILPNAKVDGLTKFSGERVLTQVTITYTITTVNYVADKRGFRYYLIQQK